MKRIIPSVFLCSVLFTSCGNYTKIMQSADYEYKYEMAKQYYADGHYSRSIILLQDVISVLKGTDKGEESLFLLGMSAYRGHDFESAASFFKKYYQTYPKGTYVKDARFYCGKSLYLCTPEPRLDQTETQGAMTELQNFIEIYPTSQFVDEAQQLLFKLQDKLIEKEYLSAKMYYDMGTYFGNCSFGGSNYQACILTAQNALKDYPYASRREDLSIMILRAKYGLAHQSIEAKKEERLSSTVDEYYGFSSEYPDSKYSEEAKGILEKANKELKKLTGKINDSIDRNSK